MRMTENTILITGGGSGIGRGLAEAFHQRGNKVVIAGRGQAKLDATVAANPGIEALNLDLSDPADIARFAQELTARFPALNVVINNAGIMTVEDVKAAKTEVAERTIATNLLGPIRLTAALLPHLQAQPSAAVVNVTSGLAFVPLLATPTYCATKAALHSYSISLRAQLADTGVQVIELPPPYVQTELMGAEQASDPNAMPLAEFVAESMELFASQPDVDEILVERVKLLRFAEKEGRYAEVFGRLSAMARSRM
ncbi:MAG: SDR family oxidoreductase [Planctomycetes bacterium]|nr:SDR family oxidoreductase [Planctomycetota bacterium]